MASDVDPARRDASPRAARTRHPRRDRDGQPEPGDKLPTVRQLAVDLRVNANTVAKVYAYLERTGAVETRRGVGTFVSGENGDRHEEARDAALRGLALKTLAEAARLGFSADDALPQIEAVTKEHGRENRDEK